MEMSGTGFTLIILCDKSTKESQDSSFVIDAFEQLIAGGHLDNFEKIYLFSDGTAKHFKNQYTLKYLADVAIKNQMEIVWCIYAQYHGWSICDSHAGIIQNLKKRLEIQGIHASATPKFIEQLKKGHINRELAIELEIIEDLEFVEDPVSKIDDCFFFVFYAEVEDHEAGFEYYPNANQEQKHKLIKYYD